MPRDVIATAARFDLADPVLASVAWARLAEPGDVRAGELVARLGATGALAMVLGGGPVPGVAGLTLARWRTRAEVLDPQREVHVMARLGGTVLHPGCEAWPTALDDLGTGAPFCLFVRGDPRLLAAARETGVAIIGARACTAYGEHVAGELAAALAGEGRVVVSGGAYGIDAVAHRVSLAVGGPTVAVMAGGLDRLYPAGNADLLNAVARHGALVAEIGPGSAPSRSRFLTRNRLIAALAAGCVVVEAGYRSGTLSTANHAAGLCRPVAAIPGPVTSAASAGCHRLLREGQAVCVTGPDEVRELLAPIGASLAPEPHDAMLARRGDAPRGLAERERVVWDALPVRAAAAVSGVARASGLAEREVRAALGILELRGHASRDGDRYRRARPSAAGR